MAGKNGTRNGLANPSRLKPFDADDKHMLRVVIETPKGSRNKFAFNAEEHIFELKKVLPAGMAFPYDFGFVPSTEADDGDSTGAKPCQKRAPGYSVPFAFTRFTRRFRDERCSHLRRFLVFYELTPLSLAREWLADVYRLGVGFSTVLMGWL
jgi:hypothetical protein